MIPDSVPRVTADGSGGISNPHRCHGSTGALGGTITMTKMTATRVKETCSATLETTGLGPPRGRIVVTEGAFDVGLADQ